MLIIGTVAIYFVLIRPQQRQEQRVRNMMNGLKKNDRVFTIGGIIATVHAIDQDKKEIILRVDDNTKVKFLLSAIAGVFEDNEKTDDKK